MKLSPDLYYALAQEYVTTEHFYDKVPKNKEKPELRTKFILSGKELLTALYTISKKAKCVQFSKLNYSKRYRMCNSRYHAYTVTERIVHIQGDYVDISISFDFTYVEPVMRWALSAIRKVVCIENTPLPEDVVDLLLMNPNFKELILERCDLITTKALMRSKKFEYIKIGSHMNKGWRRFCINTEKLSMNFDSLQNIIWNRSAKINSLCIDASDGEIIERIPGLNTRPDYPSFKILEFNVNNINVLEKIEKILQAIAFLEENFVSLEFLILNVRQYESSMHYGSDGTASRSPDFFKSLLNYKEKLSNYNGGVKVTFNHYISIEISSESADPPDDYAGKMKKKFLDFEYSSEMCNKMKCHYFKNSNNINEKIKLNTTFKLECNYSHQWFFDTDEDEDE